jgi:enamine deaminase RidA (YjgF/YER057c/UK114 family)
MGQVAHINPDALHSNPGFTQVVTTSGPGKTIYISGQNAVNAQGEIVGKGDMAAQSAQVFRNLEACLHAAGADYEHVIKWTIYAVQGHDLHPGFEAFQKVWGQRPNPPAITMAVVAGLANPDFLIELEAIAFVP